jgi:hypothetical protein
MANIFPNSFRQLLSPIAKDNQASLFPHSFPTHHRDVSSSYKFQIYLEFLDRECRVSVARFPSDFTLLHTSSFFSFHGGPTPSLTLVTRLSMLPLLLSIPTTAGNEQWIVHGLVPGPLTIFLRGASQQASPTLRTLMHIQKHRKKTHCTIW